MNILNIIEEIEKIDAEAANHLDSRRGALKNFGKMAGKLSLAALPLAVGSYFNKAYAQSSTGTRRTVLDVLNYALTLEYLEAEYYTTGYNSPVIKAAISGKPADGAIKTIRDHENEHVAFLQTVIKSLGATPVSKPTFDFTAKGTFADVFTNYGTFLAVAQAFEDTGVRAYKGQAQFLVGQGAVLEAALNIHSVEARHAAHIRYMRRGLGATQADGKLKPWITNEESGIPVAAVGAVYKGESANTQAGVNIVMTSKEGIQISQAAATEAFDEILTTDETLNIAKLFIVA